ncbi:MAG: type II-A CRISPR-associated protein Csn2 [Oscillospiraceae bacterium]|nr:type II-A CRISPR-associated protein Csn2 [Oscillospiraceae bacterium]
MKLVYPEINRVFDTEGDKVPTLIIENQPLLFRLLSDIRSQLEGEEGKCVVSDKGKVLQTAKSAELITELLGFTLNKRTLLSKTASSLEKTVMSGELYGEAIELLGELNAFLSRAAFEIDGDISFPSLGFSSIIKASGMEFREDYDSLSEKLVDYFELVEKYDRKKLFIIYGMRSFVADKEMELFLETVLQHGYNVLMIESGERDRLPSESRYIVDSSLCEIC